MSQRLRNFVELLCALLQRSFLLHDTVFMEVHQEPARAKSDAQNALQLDLLPALLDKLVQIHQVRNPSAVAR